MKKRLFTNVLSVLLLVVMSIFGLTSCGTEPETKKTIALDVTTKELVVGESFTLTATVTPEDATIIWSSSDDSIVTVDDGVVLGVGAGTATVTAKNDKAEATCTVTVVAESIVEKQKYNVTFKIGDLVLKETEVEEGSAVSYTGVTPGKAATEQYEYTFSGWALTDGGEVVDLGSIAITENKTFYAVFAESLRSYKVTWNIDGATTEESVAYGAVPAYTGTTPTKPTVGSTSYTFKGWSTALSGEVLETLPAVSGDVVYYAVFDEVTLQTKFTVTWKNGDATLGQSVDVEYEAAPTYEGETPTKEPTTEIEYVFAGWATSADGEKLETLPLVTADATYYAVFEETARKYTITWVIEGVEETSPCGYGSVPVYEGTPVKADSAECSYKFDGWALTEGGEKEETLPAVSGEATYYAVFVVDEVFAAPKFMGGKILYSAKSEEIFLPEGLLEEGVTITSAVVKAEGQEDVTAYENDAWIHSAIDLTEEELKGNFIGARTLEVRLSNGDKYSVEMSVYAGIIDALSDFPVFFNNTAVPSETNPTDYPAVAPNVYGYYIVTKDLGDGTEELTFEQEWATDYQKTNGFNGVLDGQGHTLRFKLMHGGLVGKVLGNAVIKNLGVIYSDESYVSNANDGGGYGVFGYITNGSPEIRNCYIERTNNHYQKTSVFGIMARPNKKLIIHNTVIYGFNTSNSSEYWTNMYINETSTNTFLIHARTQASGWSHITNMTKAYCDGIEDGSREVPLADIEDASKFDDNFWYKENGKLIWKGLETVTVTWVKGDESVVETFTKGDTATYTQELPQGSTTETEIVEYYWTNADGGKVNFGDVGATYTANNDVTYTLVENKATRYYTVTWIIDGEESTTDHEYNATAAHEDPVKAEDDYFTYEFKGWSLSEDGEIVELGAVTEDGIVYYAVFESTAKVTLITINEPILYSTADSNLFMPEEITFDLDLSVKISSTDGATVYYENDAWVNNFALTSEQITANAIGEIAIKIERGTDLYLATVKSYAGVIDELSDFPAFFNNDPNATAPNTYGYYIVTKDLGSYTIDGQTYTYADDLALTQSLTTDYSKNNGFNGILDGAGHTLKFNLTSGGLVGMILGGCTIKDLAVYFNDNTSTHYGVFGYMAMTAGPVIENCYIEQTNNHYKKTTTFGVMGRPLSRLILKNTVVYGFNNNMANNYNGEASAPISTSSTNAYVICGRAGAASYVQASGFTKVYENGSGLPYDTNDNKKVVPLADVADASGFNACWSKENDVITWAGKADTTFVAVVKVTA